MKYEITDAPDFGLLKISFDQINETIVAESGAMVAMSSGVKLSTSVRGGLLSAAKRKVLGGESLFQNTYQATSPGQELYLAPPSEGDLKAMKLAPGEEFFLQSGAYVAHIGPDLRIDTKWAGVKAFFGGVGFFMLRLVGPGTVFYATYGAAHEVNVEDRYICDTGHIVGFQPSLNYSIRKFGGFKGLFFSGEGLVCEFTGRGTLVLQTRNPGSLAAFLHPFRPVQSNNS
jgi:uncharacterized protein (TIGR00266 family)